MLSCIIDTIEVQDIATAEITGAFLQTGYEKVYTHINMEGKMISLLKGLHI